MAAPGMGTHHSFASESISVKAAGFRMPLESDPHLLTFMQWPAVAEIYGSEKALNAVRSRIALIANLIAKFELVVLLARPDQFELAQALIGNNVELRPIKTQDLWCCDSGPTFVVNENARLTLSQLYLGREIVSLDVDPIGEAGGGIHCSTQQQPLVRA